MSKEQPLSFFEEKYQQLTDKKMKDHQREATAVVLKNAGMDDSAEAVENLIKRIEFYMTQYTEDGSKVSDLAEEWDEIQDLYEGERSDVDESQVNAKVNVVLPNIEGQVSSMVNSTIAGSYKPKGVSDYKFAATIGAIGDTILEENKIKQLIKAAARQYLKFGNVFGKVEWDQDMFDGMGMARLVILDLEKVIVDGKIKRRSDLQRADFIIEDIGIKSIMPVYDLYGDTIALAIDLGNYSLYKIGSEYYSDEQGYTELNIWTRNNEFKNLQLLKITPAGIPIEISNPDEPYYKCVRNQYPIFFAGLYDRKGDFYCFGDGKALKDIQLLINKIYDEIILAMKYSSQGRTYMDPRGRGNVKDFLNNLPHIPFLMKNPSQNVKTERGAGVHEVVFRLLDQLFQKVQEVTRFSALMSGTSPGETMTATQAGIQMQQGAAGIDDKRSDLSDMFGDMLEYSLGLCMELWTRAQAFRVVDDPEKFQWIDARQYANIPELMPATSEFLKRFKNRNPKRTSPSWEILTTTDEAGNKVNVTKQISLDVIVSIGQGLPNNPIAMYNLIIQLAQIQLLDEKTGQPRSIMGFSQAQKMIEGYLGIKIGDVFEDEAATRPNMANPDVVAATKMQPLNQDSNVPNADRNGLAKGGTSNAI